MLSIFNMSYACDKKCIANCSAEVQYGCGFPCPKPKSNIVNGQNSPCPEGYPYEQVWTGINPYNCTSCNPNSYKYRPINSLYSGQTDKYSGASTGKCFYKSNKPYPFTNRVFADKPCSQEVSRGSVTYNSLLSEPQLYTHCIIRDY